MDDVYVLDVHDEVNIRVGVQYDLPIPPSGNGYLGSTFPDYITNVSGVPVSAQVLVKIRHPDPQIDGMTVGLTQSTISGTWLISGLHPDMKYDVIARLDGYNDLIFANVSPLTS